MNSKLSSLDFLIPESVNALAKFDDFEFKLKILSWPAAGRWPHVRVWVDAEVVWDNMVVEQAEISYAKKIKEFNTAVSLRIEYCDKKDDQDTIVDVSGQIIENQHIEIAQLFLNDVEVVAAGSIYQLGRYHMNLSEPKRQYFLEHGFSVEPSHSLSMFENGEWRLTIPTQIGRAHV